MKQKKVILYQMVEDTFHNKQTRMLISVLSLSYSFQGCPQQLILLSYIMQKVEILMQQLHRKKTMYHQNLNVLQRTNKERR